mmetsp:Transcript_86902/g.106578  ORF Transcript_86902/g.106578 Transcript_86902/m.106578 type:complete len:202 (+) Transcript_86902:255-860(+)
MYSQTLALDISLRLLKAHQSVSNHSFRCSCRCFFLWFHSHLGLHLSLTRISLFLAHHLVAATHLVPPIDHTCHTSQGTNGDDHTTGNAGRVEQGNQQANAGHCHKHHQNVDQWNQTPVGSIETQSAGGLDHHPAHHWDWEPNQNANEVETQMAESNLHTALLHHCQGCENRGEGRSNVGSKSHRQHLVNWQNSDPNQWGER